MATSIGGDTAVAERSGAKEIILGVSFEDFYTSEFEAVLGLAYALSGNRWMAEDLAQEAFLEAHRSWNRVATFEHPGAWVRRVVANRSVSAFRRRMTEAKALGKIALRQTPIVPELSADNAEFWRAVRALPRRQAQVVALRYVEDLPVDEIAEILDVAPGTVRKHLHDARPALARRLRVAEGEP